jgi:hypothetical protein
MNRKEIMRILKVDYISIPLANTSKGLFSVAMRKGEDKTFLTLDAVPLSEELERELTKYIYENLQEDTGMEENPQI